MFTVEEACLVVIDIQGKLASIVDQSEAMISNVAKLVQGIQALDIPIIWMEQNPTRIGSTNREIAQHIKGQRIAKMTLDSLLEQDVQDAVKATGRSKFILTGIETHICVYQTACALKEQGYEVEVVVDAVSSRSKENKEIWLSQNAGTRYFANEHGNDII